MTTTRDVPVAHGTTGSHVLPLVPQLRPLERRAYSFLTPNLGAVKNIDG